MMFNKLRFMFEEMLLSFHDLGLGVMQRGIKLVRYIFLLPYKKCLNLTFLYAILLMLIMFL